MEHYNLKRMIMKKSIILLAMVLGAFTANAQSVVEGTKLTDNWSVEVNAGAITPLTPVSYTHLDVYKRQNQWIAA